MPGGLLPSSPPGEKAAACQYKARQPGTDDGTGDWVRLSINEVIHNGYTRAELARRQSYIATCYPDTADFGPGSAAKNSRPASPPRPLPQSSSVSRFHGRRGRIASWVS